MDPDSGFGLLWLQCLLVVSGVSLVSTALGVLAERGFSTRTRIFDVPVPDGQLRFERRRYARFVVLLATAAAIWLWLGRVEFGDDGVGDVALTFAVQWVLFEIYYYGLHRALHTRPLYRHHAPHHESRVTTAWTGQSLSVVESVGWIAGLLVLPTIMGFFMSVSAVGCFVYFVANTFVNLVGHANVELNPIGVRGLTWLNHPWIYHSLHHARFKGHYAFVSTFMDRLFGTEWSDWPELHRRVVAGEPLESLTTRLDGARMRSQH